MKTPQDEPEAKMDARDHLSRAEKHFLAGLAVGCLVLSIGFAAGTTIWRYGFPATIVAFLLGLALATLTYAFLGGVRGSELKIGGVKLVGTAAVVLAIVYLLPGPLRSEMNDIGLIGMGRIAATQITAAEDRAEQAELKQRQAERSIRLCDQASICQMLIAVDMPPQRIAGGGSVDLEDINTLDGWNEGDIVADGASFRVKHGRHSENLRRSPRVFEVLLDQLDIQRPAAEIRDMTQHGWEAFLRGLPDHKRRQLGRIPFARLTLRSSDGRAEEVTVFRNEQVPVLNRSGDAEACLEIRRILDVRERTSGEAEVIILTHQTGPCR